MDPQARYPGPERPQTIGPGIPMTNNSRLLKKASPPETKCRAELMLSPLKNKQNKHNVLFLHFQAQGANTSPLSFFLSLNKYIGMKYALCLSHNMRIMAFSYIINKAEY